MESPRIADSITLVRHPGSPTVDVFIDGQEFPYLIDATKGIIPVLEQGRPPSVTLTIIGRRVIVDDELLVGAELDHDHAPQATDVAEGDPA